MTGAERAVLEETMLLARETVRVAAPNPGVGAIVLRDGRSVGVGRHVHARRDHAELVALRVAGAQARGADLFVSLEPCSSAGRTPPCTEAVLAAGVRRVVVAMPDPDPRHRGRGLAALRASGVEVELGPRELWEDGASINAPFCKWVTTGRPLVTVKTACSLDGRIAPRSGRSRWITGKEARSRAHALRAEASGVLCGVGTVLADDPRLSAREVGEGPAPLRIVLDPALRTPASARLLAPTEEGERAGGVVLVTASGLAEDGERALRAARLRDAGAEILEVRRGAAGLDLGDLLDRLGERRITSLLVEGGGVTASRFLAAAVVDRLCVHVAPVVLGSDRTAAAFPELGADELTDALRVEQPDLERVGEDWIVSGRVGGGFDPAVLAAELARDLRAAGSA